MWDKPFSAYNSNGKSFSGLVIFVAEHFNYSACVGATSRR